MNQIIKLLGYYKGPYNSDDNLANHILIVLKHYIHLCRTNDAIPSVAGFKARIIDTEYLEKQIATRRNKIDLHNNKWQKILAVLT